MLLGFVALIAPWGGSSGLPKEIAAFSGAPMAAVAAVATPAAAVVANTSRLDTTILRTPLFGRGGFCSGLEGGFARASELLLMLTIIRTCPAYLGSSAQRRGPSLL